MRAIVSAVRRVYWFRVLLALGLISAVNVGYQLTLPENVTSSRARVGNIDIVRMSAEEIKQTLVSLEESSYIYLSVADEQYIKKYTDLGISIETDGLAELATYTFRDKLPRLVHYTDTLPTALTRLAIPITKIWRG